MGILTLKDLTLEMGGKKILDRVNIDFWEGNVHAIVGPNGAGKSTLAYTLMGLPDYTGASGEIIYRGERINTLGIDGRARKGITLAWQDPARYEGLPVSDFIGASSGKKNAGEIRGILESFGFDPVEYMNRAVDKTLSGGERKKIELASILAMDAEFVMLDEPDSGIDVESLETIFKIIKQLKSKGVTVVLITHSLAVLKQADHAFLMCHGHIIDKGKMEKIIPYFENKCMPCAHKNVPERDKLK